MAPACLSHDKMENARNQAYAQLDSIREMVAELISAREADDTTKIEEAEQVIFEDALAVEVRSGWYTPGRDYDGPEEYRILLCNGGPAVQLVGELDEHKQPMSARLECQDWFTTWLDLALPSSDTDVLLIYAQTFYYGE